MRISHKITERGVSYAPALRQLQITLQFLGYLDMPFLPYRFGLVHFAHLRASLYNISDKISQFHNSTELPTGAPPCRAGSAGTARRGAVCACFRSHMRVGASGMPFGGAISSFSTARLRPARLRPARRRHAAARAARTALTASSPTSSMWL